MIKICIVAEYMFCGGSEKSLLSFLNCLDRSVFDITLLLLKKKGDLLDFLPKDINVEEIVLPVDEQDEILVGRREAIKKAIQKKDLVQVVKKICRVGKMAFCTRNATERRAWYYAEISEKVTDYPEEFDVVIDYMGYGLFNTFYAAKKIKGTIKFSWVHFEPEIAMPDFNAFSKILNEYNYIMCVSREGMNQVCKMMPELTDKCKTFHNIVDEDEIKKMACIETILFDRGKINIVSVGRLDPQKGYDIAINVVEKLYSEGYPIVLHIIGDGWQRGELEQLIHEKKAEDCVDLVGKKINPYPYIEACDIYIQPSRHEGYGIAVAEARVFDKPILATNFAGAKEQLVDGVTGMITECNEESIYQGLKLMIEDVELCSTFRDNLKKDHGKIPPQLEWFYDTVLRDEN